MTGRHRKPRRLSKEGRRLLGGAALLAVFAPVTAYTLNAAIAHVQSCGVETTLSVAATPEIAPVLQQFVADGGGAPSRGSDVCAHIIVTAVPSAEIADTDAHVWVPETALLLDLPEAGLDDRWDVLNGSTASGAVGLALPEGDGGDDVDPATAPVGLDDPREDPASLMWAVVLGVGDQTATADDPDALAVASGPQTLLRNAEADERLAPPAGGAQIGQFEYPMLAADGLDEHRREAAANLFRSYNSPDYTDLLMDAGFGPAVPRPPDTDADAVHDAVAAWDERFAP